MANLIRRQIRPSFCWPGLHSRWIRLSAPGSISTIASFAQFTFATFDVPGSISTNPIAIDNYGDVAGTWLDGSGKSSVFPGEWSAPPGIALADGETTVLDIGPAMQERSHSLVLLHASGHAGASAYILIGDGSVQ